MPISYATPDRDFRAFDGPEQADPPAPGLWDTLHSAARLENPVLNAIDLMSRPTFQPQDGFDITNTLHQYDADNGTSMFEGYKDRFLGVQSQDEFNYTIGRIGEQEKDHDTVARAGWVGTVASIGAGLVSPEIFIPLVGEYRGAAAVAEGAIMGAITTAPGAIVRQANQETRPAGSAALEITAGTALGGLLGSAVGLMRPAERAVAEQEIHLAARPPRPASVGAAEVEHISPGGIASGGQTISKVVDSTGLIRNPVLSNIEQTQSVTARALMQRVSDSGVAMEGNAAGIPTALGGTVEANVVPYIGKLSDAVGSIDRHFADYQFDGAAPRFAPVVRADLARLYNGGGKLTRQQFYEEVTRAIYKGGEHEIPQVRKAAQDAVDKVFNPILKEAQAQKLIPEDVQVLGDKAYVNRIYDKTVINGHTQEFMNILENHINAKLAAEFATDFEKFGAKQAKAGELVEDLSATNVGERIDAFKEHLRGLQEGKSEEVQNLEAAIATHQRTARAIKEGQVNIGSEAQLRQLRDDIRVMKKATPEYGATRQAIANVQRRLKNLSRHVDVVGERQAAKLERIDAIEQSSTDTLNRLVAKGRKLLDKMDSMSDEELDKALQDLIDRFDTAGDAYRKGADRIASMVEKEEALKLGPDDIKTLDQGHRIDVEALRQDARDDRLMRVSDQLQEAEGMDREAVRQTIQEGLDDAVAKAQRINSKRAVRAEALRAQAEKLDPELARTRLDEARLAIPRNEGEFARKWEERGAERVDPQAGAAEFKDIAKERAQAIKDNIMGTYNRLPTQSLSELGGDRGPELARMLDIPSEQIDKFLKKDITELLRTYTHTMAPDIEITRALGSRNWDDIWKPAVDEHNAFLEQLAFKYAPNQGDTAEEIAAKEAKLAKKTAKANDQFKLMGDNFAAVLSRLRHQRGLPNDPDGFAYRAFKTVQELNVLRMMGMVTISSLPDLARPIMRYGLTRTFRDGFLPLVTNLRQMKMMMDEAKLAGLGTETVLHMRANAMQDVFAATGRHSKFERGVEYATNRMGAIALFGHWTDAMKLMTSSVTNGKLMEALAVVNGAGEHMSQAKAIDFLAQNGINDEYAQRMWNEVVNNGGGGRANGMWLPQTESWRDPEMVRVYRAALAREVNNTIVTPGLERPLWSDAGTLGRALYQFKSFGMASTPKMMISGLQQRDAAVLSGSLASLGLGALSYWLYAHATGGKALETMQNAPLSKWADEAISRAGLLGGFGEFQRIGQRIPGVAPFVSFSGSRDSKRPGDTLVEALLGPTFDFAQNAAGVVTQLHDPTAQTVQQAARLLPFRNTLIIRNGMDAVTNAIASQLPDRR